MPEADYGIVDGVATYWVTKDGERIPIMEMGDDHLVNVIALILRHREKAEAEGFGNFYFQASEPKLKGLRAEIERRKHAPPKTAPQTAWERLLEE